MRRYHVPKGKLGRAPCSVDGCATNSHAGGFCQLHYNRVGRYGRTERIRYLNPDGACAVDGCGKPHHAGGYCQTHYARVQRTGEAGPAEIIPQRERRWKYRGVKCSVEGCARQAKSRSWCQMHYQRWVYSGDAVGRWGSDPRKSEGYTDSNGYFLIRVNGKPMLQHRVVMEQILGHPLRDFENVHHKNGIRNDNRPENLELWVKPQPQGQRVADLLAWMVDHYRHDVEIALKETE